NGDLISVYSSYSSMSSSGIKILGGTIKADNIYGTAIAGDVAFFTGSIEADEYILSNTAEGWSSAFTADAGATQQVNLDAILKTSGYKTSSGTAGATKTISIEDLGGQFHQIYFENGIFTQWKIDGTPQ